MLIKNITSTTSISNSKSYSLSPIKSDMQGIKFFYPGILIWREKGRGTFTTFFITKLLFVNTRISAQAKLMKPYAVIHRKFNLQVN